ncbi:hypothetical protein PG989_015970 [Apiospora arundinis]|uniref:Uncharacterized protein n=1 Tax=Apiospora arundinis TaxID=335852 RepID=A0ABR2JHR1_9PEZI
MATMFRVPAHWRHTAANPTIKHRRPRSSLVIQSSVLFRVASGQQQVADATVPRRIGTLDSQCRMKKEIASDRGENGRYFAYVSVVAIGHTDYAEHFPFLRVHNPRYAIVGSYGPEAISTDTTWTLTTLDRFFSSYRSMRPGDGGYLHHRSQIPPRRLLRHHIVTANGRTARKKKPQSSR